MPNREGESGEKVVVVDSDRQRAAQVVKILRQGGFHAKICATPARALALMRRERPRAVVLEVIMSGRSGFDIAAGMQADPQLERIPIIFTSDIQSSAGGNHDYFPRPLSEQRLIATLRKRIAVER